MSTRPSTRSRPAKSHSEGELEARVRLGLKEGLRRLGFAGFRSLLRELDCPLIGVDEARAARRSAS
jgi:hypothetical protein